MSASLSKASSQICLSDWAAHNFPLVDWRVALQLATICPFPLLSDLMTIGGNDICWNWHLVFFRGMEQQSREVQRWKILLRCNFLNIPSPIRLALLTLCPLPFSFHFPFPCLLSNSNNGWIKSAPYKMTSCPIQKPKSHRENCPLSNSFFLLQQDPKISRNCLRGTPGQWIISGPTPLPVAPSAL